MLNSSKTQTEIELIINLLIQVTHSLQQHVEEIVYLKIFKHSRTKTPLYKIKHLLLCA